VAGLRPGVREEQEDAVERGRRQHRQQQPGIVREDPDIADAAALEMVEQAGDAVDEDLGADQPDLGMSRRLGREMLAAAEADLQPDRGRRRREAALRIERRAAFGQPQGELRQAVLEQAAASRPQPAAVAAAIEVRPRLRVRVPLLRVAQWSADFSPSTRSSRSQEKPPSASAGRPKWP
jgi:hypothetical protein